MGTSPGFVKRAIGRVSLVLFVAMHLACLLVIVYPPTWPLVFLALGSYVVRMWAITVGYHRYLAHRSFRTSRVFQFILALIGCTAMENGPLWWASWHRRHHKYVDTPADPHSPRVYGFWYAHLAWIFDPKNDKTDLSNVPDLTRFPELRLLDRFAWVPLVGYALLCYAIAGPAGVVWGFVVSTIAVDHATFCINSLAHMWGSRRYETQDTSRNNPLLAALTLGEGWHNNHHFYMNSARQGFFWWEIDVSYYTLKLLSWLHLVTDVRTPPAWALTGQARASQTVAAAIPRHERDDDDRIDEAGEGSFPASDPPPWTLGRESPPPSGVTRSIQPSRADRRVVLLTGASVGLGLAIARQLMKDDGIHLVLTARAGSLARFTELGITESERLWLRPLDITDERQRRSVVQEIEELLGGVDTLINNAGITYRTVAEYATQTELEHQMVVNYEGPMALAALVLPGMRRRRNGRIIQVSSAGGLVAMPTMGLYSASKFALEAASEAMHYEVRPFGVQVSLVLPGFVNSPAYRNSVVGRLSRLATENVRDPYHAHFQYMDRLIARMMKLTHASPESVARRVVKTVYRRRAPLRVLATWDARLLWWFRRFMPQSAYIWITYRMLPGIRHWGEVSDAEARISAAPTRDEAAPAVRAVGRGI